LLFVNSKLYSQTTANNGFIDLSKYQFQKDGIIDLDGTWEFYPNELISPPNFNENNYPTKKNVKVPSLWNSSFFNKKEKFNLGYGTYRLKVNIPNKTKLLALRLKRIETAYIIFIDNDTIISCGKVGRTKKETSPTQKTVFKIFSPKDSSFFITIQVANFLHRKGGIDSPISLGTSEQIIKRTKASRGFEFLIVGVLLIMGFFHFGLYIVKRQNQSLLFFGLLLFFEMISMATNGEVIFTHLFPNMSWAVLKKIDYISNFLRSTFFALFFYKLYEEYISKIYIKIFTAINIVLTLIVLSTNLSFYAFTLFIFIGTTTITLFYILYAQIRSLINKKEGAFIPFLGTFILMITAINDILFVSDIIETVFLTPFGLFIFIFSQSYILSFSFSNLYKKTEELNKMTEKIDTIKNSLLAEQSYQPINSIKFLTEYVNGTRGLLFSVMNEKPILKSEYPNKENNNITSIPSNIIDDVLQSSETIILSGMNINKHFDKEYNLKHQAKSAACIPLKVGNNTNAILYFENNNKRNAFVKDEIDIFSHLSDQIVGIIDKYEMFEKLQDLNKNLEKTINNRTKDVRHQNELLLEQKDEMETISLELNVSLNELSKKNAIITDSIKYARYLQDANLPKEEEINSLFTNNFILYKPKEILSGDFYWAKEVENNDEKETIFALADCTGHGVPGALISVIGYDLLNHAVINKKIYKPSKILDAMQEHIVTKLGGNEDEQIKDGMEIAIISFNEGKMTLTYAGARINLIIFRDGKMTEVKGERVSITAVLHKKQKDVRFSNHIIQLKKGDTVYLYTDGFQDQFGGLKDMKFMKKRFRALLENVNTLSFSVQRSHLLKALNKWKGNKIQNDDILVAGFKF